MAAINVISQWRPHHYATSILEQFVNVVFSIVILRKMFLYNNFKWLSTICHLNNYTITVKISVKGYNIKAAYMNHSAELGCY